MEKENRNFRDSIFRMLFSDPKEIPGLYRDITKKELPKDAEINIVTLTNTMYMSQVNDLGFTVNGKLLVLAEQQSTYNGNMPLRMLMYAAREYEKLLTDEDMYRSKTKQIPAPEFYTLYLGSENEKCETTQVLSDAFFVKQEYEFLQLKVKHLNINSKEFKKYLTKNSTLSQYIHAVNELIKSSNRRECIEKLIREGYLSNFLREHSNEVVNVLTFDFDKELFGKVKKQEGLEEGLKEGREEERKKIVDKLKAKGYTDKEIDELLN